MPSASTSRLRSHALLALVAVLAACGGPPVVQRDFNEFGNDASIKIRQLAAKPADLALQAARLELIKLNADLHAWQSSSLSRINAELAAGRSVALPDALREPLRRSRTAHRASSGLFDPACGSLVELWGFHADRFPLTQPAPSEAQVRDWLAHRPSLDDVVIEDGRIHSRNPRVQLDFGAIYNGLAAERLMALLARHGVNDALLRVGSDHVAMGPARPAWRVELRDPFGGSLGSIALSGGEALFSSGNFNRFRESPDGGRWPHILDPRTGYPARGAAMVAVLHPDPVWADAASTALFVGGPGRFVATAQAMGLGCALMVSEENELLITAQMQRRVELRRHPVGLGEPLDLGDECKAPPAADTQRQ